MELSQHGWAQRTSGRNVGSSKAGDYSLEVKAFDLGGKRVWVGGQTDRKVGGESRESLVGLHVAVVHHGS